MYSLVYMELEPGPPRTTGTPGGLYRDGLWAFSNVDLNFEPRDPEHIYASMSAFPVKVRRTKADGHILTVNVN